MIAKLEDLAYMVKEIDVNNISIDDVRPDMLDIIEQLNYDANRISAILGINI